MRQWIQKNEKYMNLFFSGITVLYGLLCFFLYYKQSVADLNVAGEIAYQSDLPLHISMIVEDGWLYSFTAFAYKLLYAVCGGSTVGIALLLALCSYATVLLTENLLIVLGLARQKNWHSLLTALTLNFVMPIFIPFIGEFRYVSYQAGNIWHNSTYICMRTAALAVLLTYFKLEKTYRQGISLKEWLLFAALNIVCTGIKPSFLLAFSPIMGIFLLADLCRKVPLLNILKFGSALLPSGLVILWQNAVLFGQDTGNGISVNPWYTFSMHTNIPKLAVVCSALFCGLTLVVTCRELLKDRQYLFIVCMAALGFLEALLLVENGSRSVDGNFLWGYSFCLSVWFAVSAVKWLKRETTGIQTAVKYGLAAVYAAHLYCGLYFFFRLVEGASFYMR